MFICQYSRPSVSAGDQLQDPHGYHSPRMLDPLCKMAENSQHLYLQPHVGCGTRGCEGLTVLPSVLGPCTHFAQVKVHGLLNND